MIRFVSFRLKQWPISLLAIIWITLHAQAISTAAQAEPTFIPPTKEEWAELDKRSKQIDAELVKPMKYEWAGVYEWGAIGFAGSILKVAPDSGYVYRPYNDYLAINYIGRFDYGHIEIKNDRLILHSVRGHFGDEEAFYIKWGSRNLLLPSRHMPKFTNFLNAGCDKFQKDRNFATLHFPTKRDQLNNQVSGDLIFPDAFRYQLLESPVDLRVMSVGESLIESHFPESPTYPWRRKYTDVVVDGGSKKGVWQGMRLFVKERTNELIPAFVTDVREDSADAKVVMSFHIATYQEKEPTGPMVGWKLTSGIDDSWFYGTSTPSACRY